MRELLAIATFLTVAGTSFACSSSETTATSAGSSGSGGDGGTASESSSGSSGGSSGNGGAGATGGGGSGSGGGPIGGDRPVDVFVPSSYTPGTRIPLVILLHGYSATGDVQEFYFGLQAQAKSRGFLYAHPDGLVDGSGEQFWNATDACCNFEANPVDDSAYLSGVIADIKKAYSVDDKRVFLVGHSNGGFMAHRMACDHAGDIAAIVSLAGAMFADLDACSPTEPVSVLQIHGTADTTIHYDGGTLFPGGPPYPSAQTTVLDWVDMNGCAAAPDTSAPPVDIESSIPGAETTKQRWVDGCDPGGQVELWTIPGGSHIPALSTTFAPAILDFLYAHPKP